MFEIIKCFVDRKKYVDDIIEQEFKRLWNTSHEQQNQIEAMKQVIKDCSAMPLGQELRETLKYQVKLFSSNIPLKRCMKLKLSKAEAAKAVASSFFKRVIKGNTKRQEQRHYYCAECNAWHLTSKDKK